MLYFTEKSLAIYVSSFIIYDAYIDFMLSLLSILICRTIGNNRCSRELRCNANKRIIDNKILKLERTVVHEAYKIDETAEETDEETYKRERKRETSAQWTLG